MMATDTIAPAEALPRNVEAEAALLGALMIDNRIVERISDKLASTHFFEPLHGRIYDALVRETRLGRMANPVTLRPYFTDDEAMREVGGPGYLAMLTGSGAAVYGAIDFAAQVIELAQLRAMVGVGRAIAARAADTSEDLNFAKLVAFAEGEIAEISREASDGMEELSGAECIDRALAAAEDVHLRGVQCGIEAIDDVLGPIRRKQLVILAARPGMGKSCTASSYSLGAAARGHGVLFISLEMSSEEIGGRMASDLSFARDGRGVPLHLIEQGKLHPDQMRKIMGCRDLLAKMPIQVIDIGQATSGRLNALVRRWKRRMEARGQSLELVVVDYLQKLRPDQKTKDLYEKVTEVSGDLKACAKVNDVGILALAQLSRAVEQRGDKRPQLSDLRDSGAIEQDADAVLFLYRQEYYLTAAEPPLGDPDRDKWEEALAACRGRIEFICAKRRQGSTGKSFGEFHGAFQAVRG